MYNMRREAFMQRTHNRFCILQNSSVAVGFPLYFCELTTVPEGLPLSRQGARSESWRRPTITWCTS